MALPMNTQYQSSATTPFPKLSATTFKNLNSRAAPAAPAPVSAPAPAPTLMPAPVATPAPSLLPTPTPAVPAQPAGQALATPEQKEEISQLLAQLNSKANEVGAQQFVSQNQFEATRQGLVVDVFTDMMKQGIDPSKLDQVRDYLGKIQQKSPSLYQMFVQSFNSLLGGEPLNQSALQNIPETEPPAPTIGNEPTPVPAGSPTQSFPNLGQMSTPPVTPPVQQ